MSFHQFGVTDYDVEEAAKYIRNDLDKSPYAWKVSVTNLINNLLILAQ